MTNTAHVVLSRLFFVRLCEDLGLTKRKISHEGVAVWRRLTEEIAGRYQDLLRVAFEDVSYIYQRIFENSVFDWFGKENGDLSDLLVS